MNVLFSQIMVEWFQNYPLFPFEKKIEKLFLADSVLIRFTFDCNFNYHSYYYICGVGIIDSYRFKIQNWCVINEFIKTLLFWFSLSRKTQFRWYFLRHNWNREMNKKCRWLNASIGMKMNVIMEQQSQRIDDNQHDLNKWRECATSIRLQPFSDTKWIRAHTQSTTISMHSMHTCTVYTLLLCSTIYQTHKHTHCHLITNLKRFAHITCRI